MEILLCLRIKEKENMFWFVIFSCAAIFLKKKSRFFLLNSLNNSKTAKLDYLPLIL